MNKKAISTTIVFLIMGLLAIIVIFGVIKLLGTYAGARFFGENSIFKTLKPFEEKEFTPAEIKDTIPPKIILNIRDWTAGENDFTKSNSGCEEFSFDLEIKVIENYFKSITITDTNTKQQIPVGGNWDKTDKSQHFSYTISLKKQELFSGTYIPIVANIKIEVLDKSDNPACTKLDCKMDTRLLGGCDTVCSIKSC